MSHTRGHTTTVTHPDGTRSTRTSQRATYTHAVQVGPSDPERVATLHEEAATAKRAEADRIDAALVDPKVTVTDRGFRRAPGEGPDDGRSGQHVYHNYQARLVGTDHTVWCDSYGMTQHGYPEVVTEPVNDTLYRIASNWARILRDGARFDDAKARRLRAGDVDVLTAEDRSYRVVRWSSRRELAEKALSTFAHYAERGSSVRVVAVDE